MCCGLETWWNWSERFLNRDKGTARGVPGKKAEGVPAEFFRKQLIEPPLRRFQIHPGLWKLRQFVRTHVLQSSSASRFTAGAAGWRWWLVEADRF
jgi:hypothetical protein